LDVAALVKVARGADLRPAATVTAWQRRRFRDHWSKLSQRSKPGRPSVPREVITLIRKISSANARWGAPRIVGELRKLGIEVAKSTVEKYRVRHRNPPSPTWKAFLKTHLSELVSIDFFTVPTWASVLFVLLVLALDRQGRPFQRHRESDGALDGSANHRGLPVG
jgi:hypothetical protein